MPGAGIVGVTLLIAPSCIMGKGSRIYAREWVQRLAVCQTLSDVTNRFECLDVTGKDGRIGWDHSANKLTLLTFTNAGWMVLRTLNSHGHIRGGTLITRDSTGATRVFFGHVCGSETLEGNTLAEAYSNLLSTGVFNRKEVAFEAGE